MTTHTTSAHRPADLRTLDEGLVSLGLAIGSAVVVAKAAEDTPWLLGLGMAVVLAAVAWVAFRTRGVAAATPGFARLEKAGIAGSVAAYTLAVALLSTGTLDWGVTVIMAMLTATPALLAAHAVSRLGR